MKRCVCDWRLARLARPVRSRGLGWVLALAVFATAASLIGAEEMVTIPKSRLQELERKEAELQKLKGEFTRTTANLKKAETENAELKQQRDGAVAQARSVAAPPAAPAHASPPLSSLPPLAEGDVVDARDLANHYQADAAAADARYRKRRFQVRGEVTGFDKPPFIRNYGILLKTGGGDWRVVCDFYPSDKYRAVFTAANGTELVGLLSDESRVPIAKVGQTVTIEGQCRGASGSSVKMVGGTLKSGR